MAAQGGFAARLGGGGSAAAGGGGVQLSTDETGYRLTLDNRPISPERSRLALAVSSARRRGQVSEPGM